MTRRWALLLVPLAACSRSEPMKSPPVAGSAGSAVVKPSAFSASLSASLAKEGVKAPGSAGAAVAHAGSAAVHAGSGSATAMATASGAGSGPGSGAAPTIAAAHPTGSASPAMDLEHRVHVSVPPDIAAIKLDLDPDWDRDLGAGQTISFVLRVPNSDKKKLFVFHYGYEDPTAPGAPDAYIKWLGDHHIMNVTMNRQNGAALLVEGKDPTGDQVFRALVIYGGKKLVCYGSRYHDAAYNPLGDLRDKVVMAAEQICETLSL